MDSETSRTVVVATNNRHKIEEISGALAFPGWRFVAASELDADWPSPEEDGDTFEANARIKARAAYDRFGLAAIADDSGLEVDALEGAPGVYSSRFAGPCATDEDNNARLLMALELTPDGYRSARFRSTLVLVAEDGGEVVASGACEGQIARSPSGDRGFGYDPLFLPVATPGRTMAELSMAEKNAISHRGAALRQMAARFTGE